MSKKGINLGEFFIAKKHIAIADIQEKVVKLTMSNNEKFRITPNTSILSYGEEEGYTDVAVEPRDFDEISFEVSDYFN